MRLQVDGSQLTGLSAQLADDARSLDGAQVPKLDAAEVGHPRLADAAGSFEGAADTGVARLAGAAQALADWMLLAAEVAEADDKALAAEFRANGASPSAAIRNPGAEAASGSHP